VQKLTTNKNLWQTKRIEVKKITKKFGSHKRLNLYGQSLPFHILLVQMLIPCVIPTPLLTLLDKTLFLNQEKPL
jgi:hypothetical protein